MIRLVKITPENFDEVIALKTANGQEKYVSSVAVALAQAYVYGKTAFPFAVYNDEEPVGFIMLGFYEKKNYYTLWKFLIDEKHQRKGYGRSALKLGVEFLKREFDAKEIYTGVILGNAPAQALYQSMGFEKTGVVEDSMEEMRLDCAY